MEIYYDMAEEDRNLSESLSCSSLVVRGRCMNRSDTVGKNTSQSIVASTATTRLSGSWLIVARVVWLALSIPSLGLFVVGLPVYYQQLQRACVDPTTCGLNVALPAQGLQALASIGLSVSGYAMLVTIFSALIAVIWCAVGFLIFWRRSDDWLALLAAFFLVIINITPSSGNPTYALALAYPTFALPFSLVNFLGAVSFFAFFLLFPHGRLVPRWTGLILPLGIITAFLINFPSPTSSFVTNCPVWLALLVYGFFIVAFLVSQIYRYRRVSTPVQRQQTKWIVLGVTAVVAFDVVYFVILLLFPSLQNPNSSSGVAIGTIVLNFLFPIVALAIPLSIAFSILRYRLYDIDIIINRTLVYALLSGILALIYVGLIIALQALLRGIINQTNDVAIVVSTLAIAALFQPLRQRIQRIVDRRFYRSKYDSTKIVAAFSTTLRQEVDLEMLRERLLGVVQETMQPAHVSLWLRPPEHGGKQEAPWRVNPPVSSGGR